MGAAGSRSTAAAGSPGRDWHAAAYEYVKAKGVTGGGDAGAAGAAGVAAVGGCGCYFGGDTEKKDDIARELREYERSYAAKAKEEVIRGIARALKSTGVQVDPESDLDTIVREIDRILPNPRKNGKTFADDAKKHASICRSLGDAINKVFGAGAKPGDKIIDTTQSPEAVCRDIGEFVRSYTTGVHREFLDVYAAVRNATRNMKVLTQATRSLEDEIATKVRADGSATLTRDVAVLDEGFRRAATELAAQAEKLSNILDLKLPPAQSELELMMKDVNNNLGSDIIKPLGLKPGTKEFSTALANAVSGLGAAAAMAARVHRLLKELGVSVREFLDSANARELRGKLDTRLMSGAVKSDDVGKYLLNVEELVKMFDKRSEYSSALQASSSPAATGSYESKRGGAKHAGAGDDEKSTIDKRVEKIRVEKKAIEHEFVRKMARAYEDILTAINELTPGLGKDIPLSDRTDALRDALRRMGDLRSEQIELALIGKYLDASAREKKERFLTGVRMVSSAIDSIMEMSSYSAASARFGKLKVAIKSLESAVEFYSKVFAEKFGGQDDEESGEYYGGQDEGLLPEISRSSLSLTEAVGKFVYYYYIAKVRENLAETSKELDAYGEKYDDLLGEAVGHRINTLENEQKTREALVTAAGAAPIHAGAKEWLKNEYKTKYDLYKVLQAIDLYMKAFTMGIAKDPDAVRDIKGMLDGATVIARWFNENSGESIWRAFECMRTYTGGAATPASGLQSAPAGTDHYFQRVARLTHHDGVGVPQLGIDPTSDDAKQAKKHVADACDNFQILKNLVNAFIRIGEKFGGQNLRPLMSPTQIWKGLLDYLKCSALEVNVQGALGDLGFMVGAPAAAITNNAVPQENVYFGTVQAGRNAGGQNVPSTYDVEDRYFAFAIKAMGAKVLTVLGVYDMLERRAPIESLTPTRMIIGGAGDGDEAPEAEEKAAELYFRLPRLAEFYRDFLYWDGETGARKIAMLPELEGVFSGLIRLVFQRFMAIDNADYTEMEVRQLIREINHIYSHFRSKDGDKAVSSAVNAFVREVNRRYGVIKADDMKKYMKMIQDEKKRAADRYGTVSETTNYAILDGEDEAGLESDWRAPSDRFRMLTGQVGPSTFTYKNELDTKFADAGSHYAMLREFRRKLDQKFSQVASGPGSDELFMGTSYRLVIEQAALEMKRATTKEAKFAAAVRLIQGTSEVRLDTNKTFMFHETVVTGLNILSGVQALLRRFRATIARLDVQRLDADLREWLKNRITNGQAVAAPITRAALVGAGPDPPQISGELRRADTNTIFVANNNGDWLYARGGVPMPVTYANFYTFLTEEAKDLETQVHGGADQAARKETLNGAPLKSRFDGMCDVALRFIINYQTAMRDLLENLFDLVGGSQGLVELRIGSSRRFRFISISPSCATRASLFSQT